MLIIRYGSHSFTPGTVTYGYTRKILTTDSMRREGYGYTVNIKGELQGDDVADVKALADALNAAFATDGKDFVVTDEDTGAELFALRARDMIDGPRVVSGPDHPMGRAVEWVRMRSFEIELYAEQPVPIGDGPGGGEGEVEFTETFVFIGTGGPRRVIIETMEGAPVEQVTNQKTKCRAIQTGRRMSSLVAPIARPPLYPKFELVDQRQITYDFPRHSLIGPSKFGVSWSYVFESVGPFPNSRPY